MAQALSDVDKAQFCCSICLELLRDPVTIPCGHSYCMRCLMDYWDRQSVCNCPQCRATYNPRPKLGRNNLLVEMLEKLGAVKLNEGPSAPPMHEVLGPVGGGFEHAIFDVSSVRPERTAGQRLVGDTRRHLAAQIKERELEVQQLKQTLRSFSRLAKAAVKDSSRLFSDLMEFLERRRVEMKELIRAQEKAELTRAENHLQHLERQLAELRRRDAELEHVSHSQDDHLISQMCHSVRSPFPAELSSCLTVSPHVSFGPVRTAILELKEQLQSLYNTGFPGVTSAVKTVNLLQIEKPSKEACNPAHAPSLDQRDDLLQYFCPLSLDPFTAHKELSLSEGNRVVSRTGAIQCYPDHPDRFDTWGQALCREGLQGHSYWEAEWDGQQVAVGLTYESIGRKGSSDDCRLGHNCHSWSLQCSPSSFTFHHRKLTQEVPVPSGAAAGRIGVFLDHDAGVLCFYLVTPREVHLLHRVQAKFNQPLYPAVWLGTRSAVTFCTVDSVKASAWH